MQNSNIYDICMAKKRKARIQRNIIYYLGHTYKLIVKFKLILKIVISIKISN